jgi:putative methyltransferase
MRSRVPRVPRRNYRHVMAQRHDRAHLLGEKRTEVLTLAEVLQYGEDSFGDRDYVSLYGLKPADWYGRGVRLLGRTAVECTRDALADRIGRDVAKAAGPKAVVVDPFAGSANTLHSIARHAGARSAIGFELDHAVFEATRRNLDILGLDIELAEVDYEVGLRGLRLTEDESLIVFVAPPWGDALDEAAGLDLRLTQPPVPVIVDLLAAIFPRQHTLLAVQIYERTLLESIDEVSFRCSSSSVHMYDMNTRGQNHGLLLGRLG